MESCEEKMPRLVGELHARFAESAKLDQAIKANLRGLVMAGDFDVQLLRTVAKVRSGYAFKSEVKGAVGPPVIRKKTWCRHGGHHGLRTCARRSDFEYSKVVTVPGQNVKLGVRH